MSASAVEIERLTFRWPGATSTCLDIPHLTITRGERVFLYGPSGCGKSTLLNLMCGVMRPQTGTIRVLGQPLSAMGSVARDRLRADQIGFIFQQFNLLPWMSALENVTLACAFSPERKRRLPTGTSAHREAARLLERLGLASTDWMRPARQLSVGQQQRVAAARALIGRPALLVADEPTSALDAANQQAFIALLLHEAEAAACTLLFVSHDHRLAVHFDRQAAMTDLCRIPPENAG